LESRLGLQGVGGSGIVKINRVGEHSLIEDITEGVHRIIGAAVFGAHSQLGKKGRLGRLDVGIGRLDPLHRSPGIRIVVQCVVHRFSDAPLRRHGFLVSGRE